MMGGKLVKFDEGSCAEEESQIRKKISELKADRAAENADFDATPPKREC
jgi:hypothetical protein